MRATIPALYLGSTTHANRDDATRSAARRDGELRRLATIIEVQGRDRPATARQYLYCVREGGDAQGRALYASQGRGLRGADAARVEAFAWCREHGYEVVGYLEIPPRRR